MFQVKDLTKTSHQKHILKHLSFEVGFGQIGVFLGGSGVGKTTLLRVLNNLESYDTGFFFLENKPLNLANVNRDHTIGMVFQHFNIFEHLTVEENITLALIKLKGKTKQAASQIAHLLLERYGLLDKAKSNIHKLSGGQKQRLAIARTIALDPKIICFDEPTSALDPFLTSQVADYITELASGGRIILLTTHDLKLLEKLDGKLFLMQEGAIAETALKNDFNSNPSTYPLLNSFLRGCLQTIDSPI